MRSKPYDALADATTERLNQLDTVTLLRVPEQWDLLVTTLFALALEQHRRIIPMELRRLVRTNGAEIMARTVGQELALIAAGLVNSTLKFLAREVVRGCRELDREDPAAWEQMSVATTYRDYPGRRFSTAPDGCAVPTLAEQEAMRVLHIQPDGKVRKGASDGV